MLSVPLWQSVRELSMNGKKRNGEEEEGEGEGGGEGE